MPGVWNGARPKRQIQSCCWGRWCAEGSAFFPPAEETCCGLLVSVTLRTSQLLGLRGRVENYLAALPSPFHLGVSRS